MDMTSGRSASVRGDSRTDACVHQGTPTVTVVRLEEAGVTPDPDNARLHTPRNIGVIEDSMQMDGAGRSILVNQHGVTIAGAGAWEAATQAGILRAAVIDRRRHPRDREAHGDAGERIPLAL